MQAQHERSAAELRAARDALKVEHAAALQRQKAEAVAAAEAAAAQQKKAEAELEIRGSSQARLWHPCVLHASKQARMQQVGSLGPSDGPGTGSWPVPAVQAPSSTTSPADKMLWNGYSRIG